MGHFEHPGNSALALFILARFFLLTSLPCISLAEGSATYSPDVSFPVQHLSVVGASSNPLGDKQTFYDHLAQGCADKYGSAACDDSERVLSNLNHPRHMIVRLSSFRFFSPPRTTSRPMQRRYGRPGYMSHWLFLQVYRNMANRG